MSRRVGPPSANRRPGKRNNNRWVHSQSSTIHGNGLFARVNIPAGTLLVEYDGVRLTADEGRQSAAAGNVFVFRVNRRESIDGSVAFNLARHANHSCRPNAQSQNIAGRIWLRALRPIARGEEITYDYGYSFRDDPVPCLCRSPFCVGFIVAGRQRDRIAPRPRTSEE